VCYNRYPPHVYSNKLYSSQLLALLFGCVCLRHMVLETGLLMNDLFGHTAPVIIRKQAS
jgi:hypothetical protein